MTAHQIRSTLKPVLSSHSSAVAENGVMIIGLLGLLFDDILIDQRVSFATDWTLYTKCWYYIADDFVALADTLQTVAAGDEERTTQ